MKKKRDDSAFLSLKTTRIMKITAIFILAGILQVSAVTYAQEHRISVEVKNGTFYEVVSQKNNRNLCFSIKVKRLIIINESI